MKRLTVWTCLLLLASAGSAWSVPQIMTEYGDQTPWLGTDINAMGGTGSALYRGGMSNVFNPAFLATETSNRLDAGLSLDQEHEDRFQPLFDSFGSKITDMAIASNRHHYWQTGFGLALHDPSVGLPLTIGLSLADRYGYSYTFDEEVRNPSADPSAPYPRDILIEDRTRKVTGTLRAFSLGVGVDIMDRISVGGAVHYAFGTRTESIHRSLAYGDLSGVDGKIEQDMAGVNFTLGVRGRISERLEVGFAYENPLEASGTWAYNYHEAYTDTAMNETIEDNFKDSYYRYPQIFRGGFTFYPQTDPRTVFTAELEYIPWQKFEQNFAEGEDVTLDVEEPDLEKVVDVRIGLEHTFYNGVPLRFGFRHFNSYLDKEAGSTIFTGGTGFPIGTGLVAVSVEIMKITSYQEHNFPYPENSGGELGDIEFPVNDVARVEDTRFRVGASYTVNW